MESSLFSTMLQADSLKDKVIVVTGGGTGLGKSMSQIFLQLGAKVVITSRKTDVLEQTAKELEELTKGEVLPVACDVRDYRQVDDAMAAGMVGGSCVLCSGPCFFCFPVP